MGVSRVWVSSSMLSQFRDWSRYLNYEVGAKEGYDRNTDRYLMGVSGSEVPNARLVTAEFSTVDIDKVVVRWVKSDDS